MPVGDGAGTPVCVDDLSGLLVAGCDVTITADEIDPASVQRRVDGACTVGSMIRAINVDGSVVCGPDTNATTICAGGQFLNGDGSCDPVVVDTNTNAATICANGQFLNGDGSCYTAKPLMTQAIFGTGPITHYDAGNWILESTQSNTLVLRSTSSDFLRFSMTYPVNCTGAGSGGTADMKQVFRYTGSAGGSITGTFCAEGSTVLVTVYNFNDPVFFRCTRSTGNSNFCQRYWH
jgi:hypothetical protein